MQARIRGIKSVWFVAVAIAAVAGGVWLWLVDGASDRRAAQSVHAFESRPAIERPQPTVPPMRNEAGAPANGAIRVVAVDFPGGRSVTVPLRSMPHPGVRIQGPLTTLTDFYRQVSPLARAGDAAAAFELARKLGQCKELLSRAPSTEPAPGQLPADAERLEFCRGATLSILDEADMWRRMAIDAGYYFALQDLARELRGTPQELEIWESLWQRGYASVLQVLKMRYSQGVAGSPPDYVRAYAYKLIELGLMQAAFRDFPSLTPTQQYMLSTVTDSLRQAGSYLTPGETEAAVALAVEILTSNRNCCIGRWG